LNNLTLVADNENGKHMKKYSADEKRRMILATLEKFPGLQFAWGDFLSRLHTDYGEAGLSYGSVYPFMKKEKIADFSGTLCRKIVS
jgi:hypothetical protein